MPAALYRIDRIFQKKTNEKQSTWDILEKEFRALAFFSI